MDRAEGFLIAILVLVCLALISIVIGGAIATNAARNVCIHSGYTNFVQIAGAKYCWRIVEGTMTITPISDLEN